MSALAGYQAQIYVTSFPSVSFSNVALTDSGDHKTFTISDATKRYWDVGQPFTVQTSPDGTTWTTATSGFTIQYVGGKVVFASAITGATPSCRVTGYYMPYSFLGNASSIDITISNDVQDITSFQNPPSPWKTKLTNLADASIKLSKWWIDGSFLAYLGNRCVIVAYSGANANQRYECYAFLKQDAIKIAVDKVITSDLDFEADSAIYYIPS